jgi:hypothetical protein
MTTKITEKNISQLANAGVNWQSVLLADGSTGLTAVAGRGYFINTPQVRCNSYFTCFSKR